MDTEERDMFEEFRNDIKTIKDETLRFMSSHEVRVSEAEKDIENLTPEVRANTLFRNGTLAIVGFVATIGAIITWAPKIMVTMLSTLTRMLT